MLLLIEYIDVGLGMLLSCLNYLCSLRDENIINAVQSTGKLAVVREVGLLCCGLLEAGKRSGVEGTTPTTLALL